MKARKKSSAIERGRVQSSAVDGNRWLSSAAESVGIVVVSVALLAFAFPRRAQSPERMRLTCDIVFAYENAGAWDACHFPGVFAYASETGFGVLSSGAVTASVMVATLPVPPEYPLLETPPDRMIPALTAPVPLAEAVWKAQLTLEQAPNAPTERFAIEMDEGLRARELTLTGLTAETFAGTTRPVGKVEISLRLTEEGRVTDVVFLPGHTLDNSTLRLVEDILVEKAQAEPRDTVTQGRVRLRWRTQGDVW